jgi:dethiobiotin synthetase
MFAIESLDHTLTVMARKPPGLFITGSDTGVGKTYITALIARALRQQGHSVGVYKPVATGCQPCATGSASATTTSVVRRAHLICDDAQKLWEAAGRPGKLSNVCPQCFRAPLAPHLAAREEGKVVDPILLRDGVRYWQDRSDIVLVEGVGGLMSPVTDDEYVADVAYHIQYPLVVVVPNRIGAINQALQTLITAATFKEGLSVTGVVLNQPTEGGDSDPSLMSNCRELAVRCVPPVLTEVAFASAQFDPPLDWFRLATDALRR